MNYKICLRHAGKEDNTFLFWKPNNSGYTRCVEEAGIYEESKNKIIDFIERYTSIKVKSCVTDW